MASLGLVDVRTSPSQSVDVATPSIYCKGNVLIVTGAVARKPGVDDELAGDMRIVVRSHSGAVLHTMTIALWPTMIPATAGHKSTYELQSYWLPPAGSTFVVAFSPFEGYTLADARNYGSAGISSGHAIGSSASDSHSGVGHGR
jgi:hypothetical protein